MFNLYKITELCEISYFKIEEETMCILIIKFRIMSFKFYINYLYLITLVTDIKKSLRFVDFL